MNANYKSIILNGDWYMAYLGAEKFYSAVEPSELGFPIKDAVPAYWEDMGDRFRATTIHTKLAYNPLYTLQRYPQAGYVPDMALPNYVGSFSYSRSFTLTDISAKFYELYIGGVQNSLHAWVNGCYLGHHEGYSSEFSLAIPKDALVIGKNRITLAVSNNRLSGYMGRPVSGCTSRAANECTGGIYGDVELRAFGSWLHDAHVTVSEDTSEISVRLGRPALTDCKVEIKDGSRILRSASIYSGNSEISIDSSELTRWSPEHPKRYVCTVSTEEFEYSFTFGIRRLVSRGGRLYFNGEPFFVRGICEHGYYPSTVHPPRDKNYFRAVIKKIKSLGFNFIRFHTTVPVKEYIEAADELGILMEIETPNNTSFDEWESVVSYCKKHTAPVMYSSGNEMVIDEDYIEHLRRCAGLVHSETDSLFSPMSAMRGIEYHSWGDCKVDEPFPHNPERLAALDEFCDAYNSYSLGLLSYSSDKADPELIDYRNSIYRKPLLTHEICINGTYCDLSLKDRYRGTRIGDTEFLSSVEAHLADKGLLERAPIYYKNSSEWQRRLRKACFEAARRCESLSGYDYLGDIDHHWHTFGYCVGMMNEFYELKPGETARNVGRYNSDTVLLADLPHSVNLECGKSYEIPILVSHYGKNLKNATLNIRVGTESRVFVRKTVSVKELASGKISELYRLKFTLPRLESPAEMTLSVELHGGDTDAENVWELYAFPRVKEISKRTISAAGVTLVEDITASELIAKMERGESVALFGAGPFSSVETSFQIGQAGRTTGHLATVIRDSEVTNAFPHGGFCSRQFREMMNGSVSVILDDKAIPFSPMIEIASTYKNARREAMVFEYRVGRGRLFVCTLNLSNADVGARYLKAKMLEYLSGDAFEPRDEISVATLKSLISEKLTLELQNENEAQNANDITMR